MLPISFLTIFNHQGFLGSCVSVVPPAYIKSKATEAFSPVDTVQQYLEQFNLARKNTR